MLPLITASILGVLHIVLADGQVLASKCSDGKCCDLRVRKGLVIYQSTGLNSEHTVGRYLAEAQRLVPATEAPIRDVRSKDGWRVIVSAYLEGYDFIGPQLRFRVFDASLNLRSTVAGDYFLDQLQIGRLFGDETDVLAIETQGPHSYTVTTKLILLPQNGDPKILLTENAKLMEFRSTTRSQTGGVWLDRQTYDGVHAETKMWKRQFWQWDSALKSLVRN